jgi:hypothetical protein
VADPKLTRRAGVAMSIAMQDDEYGRSQLLRYLGELDDDDLRTLSTAARKLDGATGEVLGRRHS